MDNTALILQKPDELNERLDALALSPFVKVKKKLNPQSGIRDYLMNYKNSKGEVSSREINITKVGAKDGKIQIGAFCFLSDAPKNFLASSIISLQALPDGEVLQTYDDIVAELSKWA